MPIPGSETYRSVEPTETLPRETLPSEGASPPDVVAGEDWPVRVPTITGLNPDSAPVPGPDILVVVHGTNFTEESVIVWNNQDVATVFEREDKINTTISMTAVGVDPVYVRTGTISSNLVEFRFVPAEVHHRKKHGKHV